MGGRKLRVTKQPEVVSMTTPTKKHSQQRSGINSLADNARRCFKWRNKCVCTPVPPHPHSRTQLRPIPKLFLSIERVRGTRTFVRLGDRWNTDASLFLLIFFYGFPPSSILILLFLPIVRLPEEWDGFRVSKCQMIHHCSSFIYLGINFICMPHSTYM